MSVDQGDVQYFIGVQLDGTERVPDAAAKDGAMLVCNYFHNTFLSAHAITIKKGKGRKKNARYISTSYC